MATRTITGTVDDTGAGLLVCALQDTIVSDGVVVLAQTYSVPYDDATAFTTTLPVPNSGTAYYIFTFPNGSRYQIYLAAGGAVDLSTLIAVTGSPVADTTAAIAAHAALTSGVHGITAAGAALTTAADAAAQRNALGLGSAAVAAVTDFAPRLLPIGANNLFGVPGLSGQVVTTRTFIANRIYYEPFVVDRPITVTAMRVEVQTAVTSTLVRIGFCRLDANGFPSTTGLVLDAGEVDSGSTGVKTITGLSTVLDAGVYATIKTSNGAPTLRGVRGAQSPLWIDAMGVSGLVATMRATRTYAPLADPLPAWDVNDATGNGFEYTVFLQWSV